VVTVTRYGTLTDTRGRIVFNLYAEDLTAVTASGRVALLPNEAVDRHPAVVAHALCRLRLGMPFDWRHYCNL
jgi:hypothetical protein